MNNYGKTLLTLSLGLLIAPCWAMERGGAAASNVVVEDVSEFSSDSEGEVEQGGAAAAAADSVQSTADSANALAQKFLLYIKNQSAANFYQYVCEDYQGDINKWGREQASRGKLSANEKFFKRTYMGAKMCRSLAAARARYGVEQEFVAGVPKGMLCLWQTEQPQPIADVTRDCQESWYVTDVKTGDAEMNALIDQVKAEASSDDDFISISVVSPQVLAALLAAQHLSGSRGHSPNLAASLRAMNLDS